MMDARLRILLLPIVCSMCSCCCTYHTSHASDARVEIWGLVEKPGSYLVPEDAKILDLLSIAGGIDADVPPESMEIRVVRPIVDTLSKCHIKVVPADASKSAWQWRSGDLLVVLASQHPASDPEPLNRTGKVRVFMEGVIIQKPGFHWVRQESCLRDLFGIAGGIEQSYHDGLQHIFTGIRIIRQGTQNQEAGSWSFPQESFLTEPAAAFSFRDGDRVVFSCGHL